MSIVQLLVMEADKRPELEAIRQSAISEGTPYVPGDANLESHTGFLPVAISEQKTGFEYYFDEISDDQLPDEATRFGTHQMVARTGGDMAEMLASFLFLRTAARLSGAAYVFPDEGLIVAPAEVDAYLSSQIATIRESV